MPALARLARTSRWVFLAVAGISYPLLAHYTTAHQAADSLTGAGPDAPLTMLGALLAITPATLIALALAWRSSRRLLWLPALGGALGLLAWHWQLLETHFSWLYLFDHAASNAMLGVVFGRTLRAGQTPLCTTFAAMVHDHMPDELVRYSRQVTVAWTLFFAATATLSLLLFAFTSREVWSIFANLLSLPLLVAMFVVEYAVRLVKMPWMRGETSILDAVRAYVRSSRQGATAAPSLPPRP
ncbi:hypothetical protein OTERR_20400 [Oryzomicrobium terrae]|uniref:Transmembrane protein n=1 Tax=Oryzomicrobium terrae TaxID=1735038 RepID=A0A5C1E967_9RHOO|nr:hypothetical protein [Oryzomicrobium terrae]QEL65516.1 hypothetical protein OTERR_20400 [Oryzomicrobium terrae]